MGATSAQKRLSRDRCNGLFTEPRGAEHYPTAAKAGGNYLSSLLVGSEARRHGYQEGIALDVNGYISEAQGKTCLK